MHVLFVLLKILMGFLCEWSSLLLTNNITTTSLFVILAIVAGIVGTTTTPACFCRSLRSYDWSSGRNQDLVKNGVADGCYIPSTAVVDVGGKVIMTNTDTIGAHTFTSGIIDGFAQNPSGLFDSGILASGESIEWYPDTVGEVPYYCMLHVWMVGTIVYKK